MARPTLFNHRKFRSLSLRLGSRALALGSLELIWACGYDSGDPVVGNSDEVEYAADWKGVKGDLVSALVDSGFLDEKDGKLEIHDLSHHAPDYVQRRFRRENERIKQMSGHCPVIVQPQRDGGSGNVATPSPSPSPKGIHTDAEFEIFYQAYPKHKDKTDALSAWVKTKLKRPPLDVILAAIEQQKHSREWKEGYIKAPASWLRKGSWEDEVDINASGGNFNAPRN